MTLKDFLFNFKHAIFAGVCISFGGTAYLKSCAAFPEIGGFIGAVHPPLCDVADGIINTRLANGLLKNCLLAVLCGFIMTEAVYHSKFNGGKYLPLIFGVPLFIVCGFAHSIADIFYYAMGSAELLAENIGQIFCIWVSTLVGNFIGCNASNKRPYLAQN